MKFMKINPFMYNAEKWLNILLKSCVVNTVKYFKDIWPFFNIMRNTIKEFL